MEFDCRLQSCVRHVERCGTCLSGRSGSSPGPASSLAPKQPTSTTAPTWTPSNAPPPPSETSMAGCLVGLGGSGEEGHLTR